MISKEIFFKNHPKFRRHPMFLFDSPLKIWSSAVINFPESLIIIISIFGVISCIYLFSFLFSLFLFFFGEASVGTIIEPLDDSYSTFYQLEIKGTNYYGSNHNFLLNSPTGEIGTSFPALLIENQQRFFLIYNHNFNIFFGNLLQAILSLTTYISGIYILWVRLGYRKDSIFYKGVIAGIIILLSVSGAYYVVKDAGMFTPLYLEIKK